MKKSLYLMAIGIFFSITMPCQAMENETEVYVDVREIAAKLVYRVKGAEITFPDGSKGTFLGQLKEGNYIKNYIPKEGLNKFEWRLVPISSSNDVYYGSCSGNITFTNGVPPSAILLKFQLQGENFVCALSEKDPFLQQKSKRR
jgi:hypothetical protein